MNEPVIYRNPWWKPDPDFWRPLYGYFYLVALAVAFFAGAIWADRSDLPDPLRGERYEVVPLGNSASPMFVLINKSTGDTWTNAPINDSRYTLRDFGKLRKFEWTPRHEDF